MRIPLFLIAAALLLAGCGGNPDAPPPAPTTKADAVAFVASIAATQAPASRR